MLNLDKYAGIRSSFFSLYGRKEEYLHKRKGIKSQVLNETRDEGGKGGGRGVRGELMRD